MESEATLGTRHPKEPLLVSGNQAVARGAIEGGVALATGYPGTPSTYVIESLLRVPDLGFRVEWAINEKVALELAAGVSWSGLRSLVTMKMSGLNVAADTFLSVQFSGTVGGLVLYVADDPNVYYGMVEQDSRYYARLASAPMLTPASPQEALDFTRRSFELSEQIERPVMVLGTTTLANTSENVTLGEVNTVDRKPSFEFNVAKYAKAGPSACVQQHTDTLQALGRFGRLTESLNVLALNGSRIGVIAAGVAWNYLEEAKELSSVTPSTLKLGVAHPLPMEKIKALVSAVDTVIVLEELEPLVEEAVMAVRAEADHPVRVIGKVKGPLSRTGDYDVDVVLSAFREAYGYGEETPGAVGSRRRTGEDRSLHVERLNTFCAGCPHRATYYALNEAIVRLGYKREEVIITGDIGCTILGMNEPFRACWTEIAMGSSISLAQGFKYAGIKTPVIATIGDGTFFHAGIPALLNASHHQTDLTIVILDNHWISMTGMQPHVGSTGHSSPGDSVAIRVEDIVKAAGVQHVRRINPYQSRKMIETLMESIASPGITVVISDAECALQRKRRRKTGAALKVKAEKCVGLDVCKPSCIEILGCPAIERGEDGKAFIKPDVCTACGLCRHVCSHGAI
jgi:indolepyruvate ferredoxin oxidoreductase alpha subunit